MQKAVSVCTHIRNSLRSRSISKSNVHGRAECILYAGDVGSDVCTSIPMAEACIVPSRIHLTSRSWQ